MPCMPNPPHSSWFDHPEVRCANNEPASQCAITSSILLPYPSKYLFLNTLTPCSSYVK
jgi:hypothetical protein